VGIIYYDCSMASLSEAWTTLFLFFLFFGLPELNFGREGRVVHTI